MDPKPLRCPPDPHKAKDVSVPNNPYRKKEMPSIIDKALAIQNKYEPRKRETFSDKPLSVSDDSNSEFWQNFWSEQFTSHSEDMQLAAIYRHRSSTECEVVVYNLETQMRTLTLNTNFKVV